MNGHVDRWTGEYHARQLENKFNLCLVV